MGSSNFKQFNPNAVNMTNDTDYNSSSYRLNGVVPGQAPSALHNKLFYQVSTMAAAIGQVLADAGKTVTDANLTSLIADLKSVFIQVPAFPKGYINGPVPVYTSASTVTFKAGLKARDSANAADIELTADVPVSLASAGAAGLDSGSEASNTWYYYYLIRKSGDGTCSVMASTVNESVTGSITLPTGYDQKRQLPIVARNDGSSDIVPFIVLGSINKPYIAYDVAMDGSTVSNSVLAAGTATSFTDVSLASYVPPIARFVDVYVSTTTVGGNFFYLRKKGSTHAGKRLVIGGAQWFVETKLETDSTQNIQYKMLSGNISIGVLGFYITGVN